MDDIGLLRQQLQEAQQLAAERERGEFRTLPANTLTHKNTH